MAGIEFDGVNNKIELNTGAAAADQHILFNGNAQDFYIALDDSADDLLIGLGSTVGTTPIISLDENKLSTFSGAITVGVDDTGHDVKLFGATAGSYALWDESADDLNLIASGLGVITAKDLGVGIHIRSADSGASVSSDADELVVEGSGHSGLSILSATGDSGRICFGDSGDADIGQIIYQHGSNSLHFNTNAAEAMTVNSSGRLNIQGSGGRSILIGSTDANGATIYLDGDSNGDASGSDYSWITHDTSGRLYIVQDSPSGTNRIVFLHAQTVESLRMDSTAAVFNDGSADIDFRIESNGQDKMLYINAGDDSLHIADAGTEAHRLIVQHDGSNEHIARFKHSDGTPEGMIIQFTGGAPDGSSANFLECTDTGTTRLLIQSDGDIQNHDNAYTGISDERIKEQIKDSGSQWDDIKAMKIRKFKFKSDVAGKGDSDALWRIGVIAQELEASGMNGLVKDEVLYEEGEPNMGDNKAGDMKNPKTVKYSILYMKAIKALQECMARIETLEG